MPGGANGAQATGATRPLFLLHGAPQLQAEQSNPRGLSQLAATTRAGS
jgi:hypothetical protein